jgi:hypothetical protein
MSVLTLTIFISSPGDVGHERLEAARVLERLKGEFGGAVDLKPIEWKELPLQATADFQHQIPPSATSDIVICILWSKLGSRLSKEYQRTEGQRPPTGTEYEFITAYEANLQNASEGKVPYPKPALLVYQKTAPPERPGSREEVLAQLEQEDSLAAFLKRWFYNPDDSLKGAFHQFRTLDEFADLLTKHLRLLIKERLPESPAAPLPASEVTWRKDSPYRGLDVFDREHAPVFAGRTRAIGEIKENLCRKAASGCAFLLVYGMSGCGKSSLVRAGVLPSLTQPGVIEGVDLWRWCIFLPRAAASGSLFESLAHALLEAQALPELKERAGEERNLGRLLRGAPQEADALLEPALAGVARDAAQQQGREQSLETRLIVLVDQMEELFTQKNIDSPERRSFAALLAALARSGRVWVIATMRSDFFPRCGEIPELADLQKEGGTYPLQVPSPAEIRQMICEPAGAAGLRFEKHPQTRLGLDDVIHEDATRSHEALPLLEFALNELYKLRTEDRVLTFAAYEKLGRLDGAIAGHAEAVLTTLKPGARDTFPSVLRRLVTLEHGEPAGRQAPLAHLTISEEHQELVDGFIRERLLVMDRASDNQAVVGVVHEALLRHWPTARDLIEKDREFLHIRDRVAHEAALWIEKGKRRDYLLPIGKPTSEAKKLQERWDDPDAGLKEFIKACSRRAAQVYWSTAGVAIFILWLGQFGYHQWRSDQADKDQAVETIASLTDVPQRLLNLKDADAIPVLGAIIKAIDGTLSKVPDAPSVTRAKAVRDYLKAGLLQRQRDPLGALHAANEALTLGSGLAAEGRNSRDWATDQRNLAVFYVVQGEVLEDVAYDKGNDEDNQQALVAFDRSRSYAAHAMDDPEAQTALWRSYYDSALLQRNLSKTSTTPQDRKSRLDGAQAFIGKAVDLARQRVNQQHDEQSSADLAASTKIAQEITGMEEQQ